MDPIYVPSSSYHLFFHVLWLHHLFPGYQLTDICKRISFFLTPIFRYRQRNSSRQVLSYTSSYTSIYSALRVQSPLLFNKFSKLFLRWQKFLHNFLNSTAALVIIYRFHIFWPSSTRTNILFLFFSLSTRFSQGFSHLASQYFRTLLPASRGGVSALWPFSLSTHPIVSPTSLRQLSPKRHTLRIFFSSSSVPSSCFAVLSVLCSTLLGGGYQPSGLSLYNLSNPL
jgi:hypothetical protein